MSDAAGDPGATAGLGNGTASGRGAAGQAGTARGEKAGTARGEKARATGTFRARFVTRRLEHYPTNLARYRYLGIVVVITIILYYLYYVEGTITPLFLPYYHMSFLYFLYLLVVSNAVGAFTAFIGGLSDRIGRANLTIYGTLVVGLVQLVVVPNVHTKFGFSAAYVVIGFVEGIILVATPALIRDFSPQLGRASAMGFWTLGPTVGSLCASLVATRTLHHLPPWQDQFVISGLVCLGVVAVALVGLRELAPQLRDQIMVRKEEQALIEARAMGLDVEAATAHPLRTMFRLDLVSSSAAISVFLLIYYASVSVLTLYWVVVFNQTTANANGINTWYWAFDAGALVVAGVASDALRVRKPFMLAGTIGVMVMTLVMIAEVSHPATGYYTNVLIVSLLGVSLGTAYVPWMAGYTEAVEGHNPALSATGLAVWGWILRIIVAASFLVLPRVITTATPLVDNQAAATSLQTFQAAVPYVPLPGKPPPQALPSSIADQLDAVGPPGVALADYLQHKPIPAALAPQLSGLIAFQPLATDIQSGHAVTDAQITVVGRSSPQLAALLRAERILVPAQHASPAEWRRWWWVCLAGQGVFLVLLFTMRGRWRPSSARADLAKHEELVAEELARLGIAGTPPTAAAPAPAAAPAET